MLAVILSVIFPGLGQFYLGKSLRGLAILLLGLTPLYPLAVVLSVADVVYLNRHGAVPAFDRKEAVWGLLVVLVVIPLCFFLLGLTTVFVIRTYERFKQPQVSRQRAVEISEAIDRYVQETGFLPPSIGHLVEGRPPRAHWRTDAWGNAYYYCPRPDGSYTLISMGADSELNTDDDILVRGNAALGTNSLSSAGSSGEP